MGLVGWMRGSVWSVRYWFEVMMRTFSMDDSPFQQLAPVVAFWWTWAISGVVYWTSFWRCLWGVLASTHLPRTANYISDLLLGRRVEAVWFSETDGDSMWYLVVAKDPRHLHLLPVCLQSESLREFWSRRWNLVVSECLKWMAYDPIMEGTLRQRQHVLFGMACLPVCSSSVISSICLSCTGPALLTNIKRALHLEMPASSS